MTHKGLFKVTLAKFVESRDFGLRLVFIEEGGRYFTSACFDFPLLLPRLN